MINDKIKEQLREYISKYYINDILSADISVFEQTDSDRDFLRSNRMCNYVIPLKESKSKDIKESASYVDYSVAEPVQEKSACLAKYSIEREDKFVTKPKFAQVLIKYIDSKHMTDSECYKKAGVDRRLFSKIRNDKDYTPSKKTVFAFVLALQLNVQQAQELMESAGYAISYSYLRDVIVLYCLENNIYNLYDVNALLEENGAEMIIFE